MSWFRNDPFFRDFDDFFSFRPSRQLALTHDNDDNDERAMMPFGGSSGFGGPRFPPMQINTTENTHEISCEVPGVPKESLDVNLTNDRSGNQYLTISGEKKDNVRHEDKERGYYSEFRSFGSFSRSVRVPRETQPEDIQANYSDGVLKVTVPRRDDEQQPTSNTRRINIE